MEGPTLYNDVKNIILYYKFQYRTKLCNNMYQKKTKIYPDHNDIIKIDNTYFNWRNINARCNYTGHIFCLFHIHDDIRLPKNY